MSYKYRLFIMFSKYPYHKFTYFLLFFKNNRCLRGLCQVTILYIRHLYLTSYLLRIYQQYVDKYLLQVKYIQVYKKFLLLQRRNGRVVECGGLENRCPFTRTGGSNPSFSASPQTNPGVSRGFYLY